MIYDMELFLQQCLDVYEKLCPGKINYKKASTPFLDETSFSD